jgi:predicted AAA+ superfamily ATPase
MREIPNEQVLRRMRAENIWWERPNGISDDYARLPRRAYLDIYFALVRQSAVKRAVLLMGQRRVGKTVMVHHAIQRLLDDGVDPRRICYLSVDHPIYNGCGLHDLLDNYREIVEQPTDRGEYFIFFDEIQYLKDWETHLKALVDDLPNAHFTASGSAAAALRLKSNESGAGRFTDFLLPPVTFYEYLHLLGNQGLIEDDPSDDFVFRASDITALNESFLRYLNYGGYPEAIFSAAIQADPARLIKSDIIDKVLLRDLPSLYGIQDIQELNYLFTTLAFNTANEVSLEQLAQSSGVAKNTIKRYVEYLEAAFLIKIVHRIDRSARRFQRANYFKVYLTNPSIRSALFSPIDGNDQAIGDVAETAVFAQWFHAPHQLYYARWDKGGVDMVSLDSMQKPAWAVEVKWSDRFFERPSELKNLVSFAEANAIARISSTTRTLQGIREVGHVRVRFVPTSVYCYTLGANIIGNFGRRAATSADAPSAP